MFTHRVLLDTEAFNEKPEDGIGVINNRLVRNPVDIPIRELAIASGKNGQAFTPGYHQSKRGVEYCKGASIIALDIDNQYQIGKRDNQKKLKAPNEVYYTPEKTLERLRDYDLRLAYYYYSFSHTDEWNKFRLVFQLDRIIIDDQFYKHILGILFSLFPKIEFDGVTASAIDTSQSSIASMFFGGKGLVEVDYKNVLDIDKLMEHAPFIVASNRSPTNFNRTVRSVNRKLLGFGYGNKQHTVYINNIDSVENASFSQSTDISKHNENLTISSPNPSPNNSSKHVKIIRNVDFEELRKKIKILDDFMTPTIKLIHDKLLGLATNLRYMEGGQALFCRCIDSNPDYKQVEKKKIIQYCKSKNYPPFYLDTFSPYEEDHKYGNLLKAAQKKSIIRLAPYQGISFDESRIKLDSLFKGII